MAGKAPGNRKSTSTKKATQQKGSTATPIENSSTVTPISQSPIQGLGSKPSQNSAQSQLSSRVAGPELVERIRVRAYELFELRGRREGFHQEDWAQAEAEVLAIFEREKSA